MKNRRGFILVTVTTAGGLAFADPAQAGDVYRMTAYCAANCEQCEWYLFKQCPTCKRLGAGGCKIKDCARAKGVATCAHCAELDSCTKLNPFRRSMVHALRRQMAAVKGSC